MQEQVASAPPFVDDTGDADEPIAGLSVVERRKAVVTLEIEYDPTEAWEAHPSQWNFADLLDAPAKVVSYKQARFEEAVS